MSAINASPLAVAQVVATQSATSREKLTLEDVNEWLMMQDDATRQIVASGMFSELEKLRAEALAEGRAAGLNAAKAEVKAQYTSGLEVLRALAVKSEKAFEQQCEDLCHHCASIVGEALAKLAGPALMKPEACIEAVRAAVTHVRGARELVIRVNQQDEPRLLSLKGEIAEAFGSSTLSIVSDSRVASGGCLVESSFGDIDARWETKLRSLIEVLRGAGNVAAENRKDQS